MITNKIFVIEPMFSKNPLLKKELKKYFRNIVFNYKKITTPSLINKIKEAEGIILGLQTFDKQVINAASKLKILAKFGVGMDNVDIQECKKKKITIKRAINCNSISVAELVVSNCINIQRNINENYLHLKNKYWKKFEGEEIYKKKIGIIGLGACGKEVAKRLKAFDCEILINDIKVDKKFCKKYALKSVSLKKILTECEIITIHVPLTDKTHNLISIKELKLMKKNTILINTARGQVINFKSLKKILQTKRIRLFIDAFASEPLGRDNILNKKNSIFTPHIGGTTVESKLRIGRKNIRDLREKFNK